MSAEVAQAFAEVRYLPDGPAKVAALERVIALADAENDDDAAFGARRAHLTACEFGGRADRAVPSFAWCLARHDQEPQRFPELLWEYKWVTVSLPRIASVPRAQVEATIDDMERRYRAAGGSMVPVAKVRYRAAWTMGDRDEAMRWREEWHRLQRSTTGHAYLSDCRACDAAEDAAMLCELRRDDEALQVASPVFEGRMSCRVVPQFTLGELLPSLVRAGRHEQAAESHARGYAMTQSNPEFLHPITFNIGYLTHVGDTHQALRLVDRHQPWAEETRDDEARAAFFLAARRAVDAHLADPKPPTDDLRLFDPPARPPRPDDEVEALERRRAWLDAEHLRVADALDARNGNSTYRDARALDPFS